MLANGFAMSWFRRYGCRCSVATRQIVDRCRIGGLLLRPKSFNASFGAEAYGVKYEHYNGQNYLAKTLHERTYERDPGFLGFKERTGLKFRSHTEFDKADVDERQELYRQIAIQIWSADSIRNAAT